jgi:hypothetical protein
VRFHLIKLGWIEIDAAGVRLTVTGKLALIGMQACVGAIT